MSPRTSTLVALSIALAACDAGSSARSADAASEPREAPAAPRDPPAPAPRELTVFAASSLQETFTAIARRFEAAHPGTQVKLSFAGSQELRVQLENGAAADVFASADVRNMEGPRAAGLVEPEVVFARNVLVLVVPRGNPSKIRAIEDLPRARRIVVGAPEVPVGAYTVQVLDAAARRLGPAFRAQVEAHIASRELNVRQVLAKVTLGEADAAVVYRTDAQSRADAVQTIELPADLLVTAEYPMAVLRRAREPALAREWSEAVLGPDAQRLLAAQGFLPAPP